MAKISASKLNPHDVVVIEGIKVKVIKAVRTGSPVTRVDLMVKDLATSRSNKFEVRGIDPEREFEYVGDARIA